MGHLLRVIDKGQKISWLRACLESCSAGFVGFLMMLLCQAFHLTQEWTGIVVGVAGWLGASASIRMLEVLIRQRLGLDRIRRDRF